MLRERRSKVRERYYICRRSDGAILGSIGVSGIERGVFLSGHLGWWMGAPFARQGYATEALPLMLERCFEGLGLHRVEANIRPENTASRRLARRAGFRLEGYSPRFLRIDGAWRDHERWGMTIEDWEEKRGGRRARVRSP
jgi:ribosomal-protein-alanine N-acetyltransferase